jgi:heme/copper-type cytochrome/quinol oxidase subunit 2
MKSMRRILTGGMLALALLTALAFPAAASPVGHEAPEGSEWIMADWMFLSFAIFAGVAFLAFMVALKRGLLSNLEDAKYYVLEIEEEDYYSPDWGPGGER